MSEANVQTRSQGPPEPQLLPDKIECDAHDDVSHCIKCLKLVLPAIADGTPEPSVPLAISSACDTASIINLEDWRHLILKLTRKYDSRYS